MRQICHFVDDCRGKINKLNVIKILTSAAPLTNFSKKEPSSSTRDETVSCVNVCLTRVSFVKLFGSRSNSAFCLGEREASIVA